MQYQQTLEYIKNLTKFGMNLGLGRIQELLNRLGNPQLKLKTIHVGGTNGKGSTTSMIAKVLQQASYRVGVFTSPHLHRYTERFCINGVEISEQQVADLIQEIKPHLEAMVADGFEHPTEFEVSTALACYYFEQQQVDLAIFEVGLGGAIDSTNVVQPLVSVITNVSIDHMDYLGHTVTEIARVKAGIIKPGVPVVTAATGAALTVIEEVCKKQQAPLTVVGQQISWQQTTNPSLTGQCFTITSPRQVYEHIFLPLLGEHQQINATTAVAVLEQLNQYGISITPEIARQGLAKVNWPGRFEVLSGPPTIVMDGAHNLAGAQALAHTLQTYFPQRRLVMVLGMLGDKERKRVIETLAPLAAAIMVTKPNNPRAGVWQQVADWCLEYVPEVYCCEQVPEAVDKGLALTNPGDVLCITGSLYMLAEAREHLVK